MIDPVDALESRVVAAYRERTQASERLFSRASRVLPGGVSGNLRFFRPYPLYMARGDGARMTDVDGRSFIDCFLCNGPMVLGHRRPEIVDAIERAAPLGSLVLNPALMVDCAEKLAAIVPCAERVRFLNSGTEAVMAALRIARAFAGKRKIIKFFGHYHGQDDQMLVGMGPTRTPLGAGVTTGAYDQTVTLPFGDEGAVESVLAEDDDVAAVLLDAAMHSGGLWGARTEFLRALRTLTEKRGVVLIFDEVITGFRLSAGGAQALHGVTPDLATFAKALGAGEKLAAVAGRADIMSVVDPVGADPARRAFQSGTGNDGSRALAAGSAAMNLYAAFDRDGGYSRLERRAARLASGLRAAFAEADIPCHVNQIASMLQIFLTPEPARFETCATLDTRLVDLFYLALLSRGVMLSLPTSNHIYLSFAHTDADIDVVIAEARSVIEDFGFGDAWASLLKTGGWHA